MRKFKKPIIREMKPEDLAEIANWEIQYSNDKDFESTKKYLDYTAPEFKEYLASKGISSNEMPTPSLLNLIDMYYINEVSSEAYDPNEAKNLAYVMLNENKEIVLFSLLTFQDFTSHVNPAFIDALVVHPKHQNKGIATKFLTELFADQKRFFGWKPDEFATSFNPNNPAGSKLFKKFGFNVTETEAYTDAETKSPKLISQAAPSGLGE